MTDQAVSPELANPSTSEASAAAEPAAPALPPFTFDDLPTDLRAAVHAAGWQVPMPVQARVIPHLLKGQDVIAQSRTGSGKTGAFVLPLLAMVDAGRNECQALILVPTRELAQQVKGEIDRLSRNQPMRSVCIYGGVGYKTQLDALREGVHVAVATPGRLLDLLNRSLLSLRGLKYLILDEADELLSMGFFPDLLRVKAFLPRQRLSCMFSATIPASVQRLSHEFLYQPQFIGLSGDSVHVPDMEHLYYVVEDMWKDRALMRIIEAENPPNGIIFCNRKDEVDYLSTMLKRNGYDVDQLSGDLSQRDRDAVMGKLKRQRLRFLVATDVAARGIDVSHLEYVFIYDWPKDFEQYVHRAGRTGRAGRSGVAISLVNVLEEIDLKRHAKRQGLNFCARQVPADVDVQNRIAERMLARLEAQVRDLDKPGRDRLPRYTKLLESFDGSEHGRDLLSWLLDNFHMAMVKQASMPPIVVDEPGDETLPGVDSAYEDSGPVRESPRRREGHQSRGGRQGGSGGGGGGRRRRSGGPRSGGDGQTQAGGAPAGSGPVSS